MKNTLFLSAIVAAGLCASASAADVTVGLDVKSAYVATGATVSDDWVFCPWVDVSGLKVGDTALPLSFGVWANFDWFGSDNRSECSEIDFNIDLDGSALWTFDEKFTWKVGYLEYDYPNSGAEADHLIRFQAAYKDSFDLNPTLVAKYRISGPSEGALELGLAGSRMYDLENGLKLGVSADVWFIRQSDDVRKYDLADNGLACFDLAATLYYGNCYASLTWVYELDDDVLKGHDEDFVFAVGASYSF